MVPSNECLRVIANDPDAIVQTLTTAATGDGAWHTATMPRVAHQPATLEEAFMVAVGAGRVPAQRNAG